MRRPLERPVRPPARRGHWGQSAVEFALAIPVFLLLTLGIVDLGRGIAAYSQLSNCAREGARAGIFSSIDDGAIRDAVNAQSSFLGSIPAGDIKISPAYPRPGDGTITVEVEYRFRPVTTTIIEAVGLEITMSASSTMPMEW